jgi:GTP-sensing pleiotropic transcriptional regulator CodY
MTDIEFLKNLLKKYIDQKDIAEEIKKYIDQKELDEAIERHVIKSAEIVKNIPIENRTILHPNETKDNNNV